MVVLPETASDEKILEAVRAFVSYLAKEKYEDAWAMVDPGTGEGQWTPDLIKTVITNYGSIDPRADGRTFVVTPLENAPPTTSKVYQEVDRHETPPENAPEVVADVWFDVPLNGEWSDVTITFDVIKVSGGLALRLEEIHVM